MTFDAHVLPETMSFGLTRAAGSQSAIGNDTFFMGVVAGGACDIALFAQGEQDAVLGFHVFYAGQYLIRRFAKMFGMEGLSGFYHMASDAQGGHVPDELGVPKASMFFIWYFCVAVKAGLLHNFSFGIQLPVGIVLLIVGLVVAFVTDRHHGVIGCIPQKFLLFYKYSFGLVILALGDDIVTGGASDVALLQGEGRRYSILQIFRRCDVNRMDIILG
jgi:hypothetical protein